LAGQPGITGTEAVLLTRAFPEIQRTARRRNRGNQLMTVLDSSHMTATQKQSNWAINGFSDKCLESLVLSKFAAHGQIERQLV